VLPHCPALLSFCYSLLLLYFGQINDDDDDDDNDIDRRYDTTVRCSRILHSKKKTASSVYGLWYVN